MFPVDLLNLRSKCIHSYISVLIREIDVEVWSAWNQRNVGRWVAFSPHTALAFRKRRETAAKN